MDGVLVPGDRIWVQEKLDGANASFVRVTMTSYLRSPEMFNFTRKMTFVDFTNGHEDLKWTSCRRLRYVI